MNSLELKTNARVIKINGRSYRMDFDMEALSQAEQVYFTHYGRNVNISEIIKELSEVKMSAVMALAYGALISAGNTIEWRTFSKEIFNFTNFDKVFDVVEEAVRAMFESPADGSGSADSKN